MKKVLLTISLFLLLIIPQSSFSSEIDEYEIIRIFSSGVVIPINKTFVIEISEEKFFPKKGQGFFITHWEINNNGWWYISLHDFVKTKK